MIEHERTQGSEHHIDLDNASVEELVSLTKGYSGADLKSLVSEAAMIPLRQIEDIANVDAAEIRPLNLEDFREAL